MSTFKETLKKKAWPIGITAFLILFVLLLLVMVFFSTLQNNDLVTKHYYAEGLKYEEQKEKIERSLLPENNIALYYSKRNATVTCTFPEFVSPDSIEGEIIFYRPSRAFYDRTFSIELNENRQQEISVERFQKGYWKVQIPWKVNGVEYFTEQTLIINK